MTNKFDPLRINRRSFLQTTGTAFGAAALLPLLDHGSQARATSGALSSPPPGADPDELFMAGWFTAAAQGYQRLLDTEPGNAHAVAQLGYIALLSNRFAPAERFLTEAIDLSPDDSASKSRLADCFVRQDEFASAVPLLRAAGEDAVATQYASLTGKPYEFYGAMTARLPFEVIDPLLVVNASVNGTPATFFLDTGSTLALTPELAEKAGIRAVSSQSASQAGRTVTVWYGVMDSFQLGRITIRNVPVIWNDAQLPTVPGAAQQPLGAIGTTLFYHFLTTMDYAGGALILRRKSDAQLRAFQTRATLTPAAPLWLATDHFLYSKGRVNDYGPGLIFIDTGGPGKGILLRPDQAARAGVVPDYTKPTQFHGVTVYPGTVDAASLGAAERHNVPGDVGPLPSSQFDDIATFSHEFFKPVSVTFDFVNMTIYIQQFHHRSGVPA